MSQVLYSVFLCVFGAVLLRWCVSLGSYSGKNKPPMFGDYEAQRHWQEITYNLPLNQWYLNSSKNNLQYWGLDYPPLTAYHSWLCGYVANAINPDWVALESSRGFESEQHKLFMRYTVVLFGLWCFPTRSNVHKVLMAGVVLVYPGLVLIDHGHFQYNSISLGLCLWGVLTLCKGWDMLGSIAFVMALSYKQMELYHSMPFFFYLLGKSLSMNSWSKRLIHLSKLGVAVIGTFIVCLWTTLTAVLPSCLNVMRHPSVDRFLLCLVNSSLGFFLFSYQVHEKSILVAAMPVCLLLPFKPHICVWFLMISTFSMWPLLEKDGVVTSYVPAVLLFYASAHYAFQLGKSCFKMKLMFSLSMLGAIGLHILSATIPTPKRYPDLYSVLISLYSCCHFILFFLYFNILQYTLPYISSSIIHKKHN